MSSQHVNARPRPLSILHFCDKVANIDAEISSLVQSLLVNLTKDLKQDLEQDEDWKDLVDYAVVDIRDGKISVRVEHPLAEELEFGTPNIAMKPKIRAFTSTAKDKISRQLSESISKDLK